LAVVAVANSVVADLAGIVNEARLSRLAGLLETHGGRVAPHCGDVDMRRGVVRPRSSSTPIRGLR
jgi:hypothetical protein